MDIETIAAAALYKGQILTNTLGASIHIVSAGPRAVTYSHTPNGRYLNDRVERRIFDRWIARGTWTPA